MNLHIILQISMPEVLPDATLSGMISSNVNIKLLLMVKINNRTDESKEAVSDLLDGAQSRNSNDSCG